MFAKNTPNSFLHLLGIAFSPNVTRIEMPAWNKYLSWVGTLHWSTPRHGLTVRKPCCAPYPHGRNPPPPPYPTDIHIWHLPQRAPHSGISSIRPRGTLFNYLKNKSTITVDCLHLNAANKLSFMCLLEWFNKRLRMTGMELSLVFNFWGIIANVDDSPIPSPVKVFAASKFNIRMNESFGGSVGLRV